GPSTSLVRMANPVRRAEAGRASFIWITPPRWVRSQTIATLFPYTTLFRSWSGSEPVEPRGVVHQDLLAQRRIGRPHREKILVDKDRKSTRLNSGHRTISYAVFCLKKKKKHNR